MQTCETLPVRRECCLNLIIKMFWTSAASCRRLPSVVDHAKTRLSHDRGMCEKRKNHHVSHRLGEMVDARHSTWIPRAGVLVLALVFDREASCVCCVSVGVSVGLRVFRIR